MSLLRSAEHRLGLSSRLRHRVLKVARTVANLAGEECVSTPHVAEAIQNRVLDRRGRGQRHYPTPRHP